MKSLLEALAETLAQSPSEFLSSLYKDDSAEEFIEEGQIVDKVKTLLSTKFKTFKEEQKNRFFKEGRKSFENAIKADFDSDLLGLIYSRLTSTT